MSSAHAQNIMYQFFVDNIDDCWLWQYFWDFAKYHILANVIKIDLFFTLQKYCCLEILPLLRLKCQYSKLFKINNLLDALSALEDVLQQKS